MNLKPQIDRLTGSHRVRKVVRWSITAAVLVLVMWFAGDSLRRGWAQLSSVALQLSPAWVCISAVLYVVGLMPMAFFWWLALKCLGEHPAAAAAVRGYYLGHLGKYVPGKAMVAVLRTGVVVRAGCNVRRAVVSVFLETLTFMATGGALAAMLLVTTGDASVLHALLASGLAILVGLPVAPPIARRLAGRVLARTSGGESGSEDSLAGLTWTLAGCGVACSAVAWTVLGLSLWATVRAVGVDAAPPLGELGLWVESVTLPVVAGFLSLIPGGLLVRDALQVELLETSVSAELAMVAVALWRVVSIASEAGTCAILEVSRLLRSVTSPRDDRP